MQILIRKLSTLSILRSILLFCCAIWLGSASTFSAVAQDNTPCDASEDVYLMSYFTTGQEALHLAYSCDGYAWGTLNDGEPTIRSVVSTGSMRDPFVLPDPRDDGFHLIWTDGWNSNGIGYAHSADLIHWGEQRVLPLMSAVEHTKNMWAPEIFYDHTADEFRLIWSSTVLETETERFLNAWNHRIWTATTEDFLTFTPSEKYFDPGYTVIDATLICHNQEYVIFYKDERGINIPSSIQKAMRLATAETVTGPFEPKEGLITPKWTEGPAVFSDPNGRWLMFYDHFTKGHFGASASRDLFHWEIVTDQIVFPPHPRHGAVFTVPHKTFERLIAALG